MSDLVLTATSFDKNKKIYRDYYLLGLARFTGKLKSLEDKAVNDALPPLPVAQ